MSKWAVALINIPSKNRGPLFPLVNLTCRLTTSLYDAGLFVLLTINYRRHDAAG